MSAFDEVVAILEIQDRLGITDSSIPTAWLRRWHDEWAADKRLSDRRLKQVENYAAAWRVAECKLDRIGDCLAQLPEPKTDDRATYSLGYSITRSIDDDYSRILNSGFGAAATIDEDGPSGLPEPQPLGWFARVCRRIRDVLA
jgi:hypothetical protein